MFQDPFSVLGVSPSSDVPAIRSAYRSRVKTCHPDQFMQEADKKKAQEQLIELNLAYEEAIKIAAKRKVGFNQISAEEAKHFAKRLMQQENWANALRQLNRAVSKDADWYCLQGDILMHLNEYERAHASYRKAVTQVPNHNPYRERALRAAVALKQSKTVGGKIKNWLKKHHITKT